MKAKKGGAQNSTQQGFQVEKKWLHPGICTRRDELQEKVADTLWRDKDGYVMYKGQ